MIDDCRGRPWLEIINRYIHTYIDLKKWDLAGYDGGGVGSDGVYSGRVGGFNFWGVSYNMIVHYELRTLAKVRVAVAFQVQFWKHIAS